MDQAIYDKSGLCVRCKGTNVCHNCHGSGRKVLEKNSILSEETEVPCPTCYGGGGCVFCRGEKRPARAFVSVNVLNRVKHI